MELNLTYLNQDERVGTVRKALESGWRLGHITSIDGKQILTLLLSPSSGKITCYETPLDSQEYSSITPVIPQAHWFERSTWDLFGLKPKNHPRLKSTHMHSCSTEDSYPLSGFARESNAYEFMRVEGEGLYEIPVGPIHAGIIEPAHFRFTCYGEVIVNLEIRLGYVHRGVEKRLAETHYSRARFIVEAAASDMPVANALASAIAIESMLDLEVPRQIVVLRAMALEIERLAMHLSDLGGVAGDIGYLSVAAAFARLRGTALNIGEILSGNRFMRSFIRPGSVKRMPDAESVNRISSLLRILRKEAQSATAFLLDNQVAIDRMENVGKISHSLAEEFGLVGLTARACGIEYDCRTIWHHNIKALADLPVALQTGGDVLARVKVRLQEISSSLSLVEQLLAEVDTSWALPPLQLPASLPPNKVSTGIVESHRGELIHLLVSNATGQIRRYAIKNPSMTNWTGLAIAARNNLLSDFPLCNKSFSLSYSGHDL